MLVYAGEYDLICNWLGKFVGVQEPVSWVEDKESERMYWLTLARQGTQGALKPWNGLVSKNMWDPLLFHL